MYVEQCEKYKKEQVEEIMYKYIFCNELNLDCHKPKENPLFNVWVLGTIIFIVL